jgi:hypothetical protein
MSAHLAPHHQRKNQRVADVSDLDRLCADYDEADGDCMDEDLIALILKRFSPMHSSVATTHASSPYKTLVALQSGLLAVKNLNAGPASRSGDISHAMNSEVPRMAKAAFPVSRNGGRGGRRQGHGRRFGEVRGRTSGCYARVASVTLAVVAEAEERASCAVWWVIRPGQSGDSEPKSCADL